MATKPPAFDEILRKALKSFADIYGSIAEIAACAPGRVNVIGEHIDYCDGFVLPMVSNQCFKSGL